MGDVGQTLPHFFLGKALVGDEKCSTSMTLGVCMYVCRRLNYLMLLYSTSNSNASCEIGMYCLAFLHLLSRCVRVISF